MVLKDNRYIGGELELFQHAVGWKKYFSRMVRPYIRGRVLEVGAGIGGTTAALRTGRVDYWICLEPDETLAEELRRRIAGDSALSGCSVRTERIDQLPEEESFDTILYIDVLEHIEDDQGELEQAMSRLAPGGSLIVLSPAHQWLYSEFDREIGHFRRYTRRTLLRAAPRGAALSRSIYLDSVGMLASAANRLLLSQSLPNPRQVLFWDRVMVPASRLLDPLLRYTIGKSVIAVWTKPAGGSRPASGRAGA